jgi:hypothetical protein
MGATALSLLPTLKGGFLTTLGASYGGANLGDSGQSFGMGMESLAALLNSSGGLAATMGGHQRRWEDWKLQEKLADSELKQIAKQIAAAEIRLEIAQKDLDNHDLQVRNAREVDSYMRGKFTNGELYDWMASELSTLYFQGYGMAYDAAKRAEQAYRYELGLDDTVKVVRFGHWESLRKGLLAGERLHQDIKRMETSYLDLNKREYELSKTVSLAMVAPLALLQLKETGQASVDLPEILFDLDYPGHFMRRLKSVALTIPCVTGPYMGVNCTLTLVSSHYRRDNTLPGTDKYARQGDNDPRFVDRIAIDQSITTSHGQNDSGLFEPNLHDERYLPFEGAGADSRWQLTLDKDSNRFDFNTISDVLFHIKYTARDGGLARNGGTDFTKAAKTEIARRLAAAADTPQVRLFSAKHDFSDEWYRFLTPPEDESVLTLAVDLRDRFPSPVGRTTALSRVDLYLKAAALPVGVVPDIPGNLLEERAAGAPLLLKSLLFNVSGDTAKAIDGLCHDFVPR